jgi:uncharacterized protein YcfL
MIKINRHRVVSKIITITGLLFALTLTTVPPAQTSTVGSKLEQLGEMTYLEVTDLRTTQKNGLLTIQAEITNVSASNERLFYRFKWLDSSGFSAWDEEPWKPVVIYGKQRYLINVVAPTLEATDFRLQLQSPNNTTNADYHHHE